MGVTRLFYEDDGFYTVLKYTEIKVNPYKTHRQLHQVEDGPNQTRYALRPPLYVEGLKVKPEKQIKKNLYGYKIV